MASWVCFECTTVHAVGSPACPQCGATDAYEQGDDTMAKITRHGGATDKTLPIIEIPTIELVAMPGEALPEVPVDAYGPDAVPLEPEAKVDSAPMAPEAAQPGRTRSRGNPRR